MRRRIGPSTPEELDCLRRFARGFVHALNNYLSAASGYHQLIQMSLQTPKENLDPKVLSNFVQEGESAVLQAGDLLSAVARWARPIRASLYDLTLESVVSAVLEEIREREPQNGERVRLELEEGLPCILGDAGLLRQCFRSVLNNALLATPAGDPVTVSVRRLSGEHPCQEIAVRDRGAGIDEGQTPFLWIPVAASYKPSTEGALAWSGPGLGLPLAFMCAEIHGGTVEIETGDDASEGATVLIRIPEKQQKAPSET